MQRIAQSAFRQVRSRERDEIARELLDRDPDEYESVALLQLAQEDDWRATDKRASRELMLKSAKRAIVRQVKQDAQRLISERAIGGHAELSVVANDGARDQQRIDQREAWGGPVKAVKRKRRKPGEVVAPLPALYLTPPSPDTDASQRATLARAIASLDEAQRSVVQAIHIRGLSQADAARELGMTRAQVRTHERAGLARLGVGSMAGGG